MGDEKVVRIRVLAVADPSLKNAFVPFEEAAKKARAKAQRELSGARTPASDTNRGGAYRSSYRDDERAHRDNESRKLRETERNQKYIERVKYNSMLAEQRMDERLGRERAAQMRKERSERAEMFRGVGKAFGRAGLSMARSVIGTAGDMARGAGIDWSAGTLMQRRIDLQRTAINIANTGARASGKPATEKDVTDIEGTIRNTGDATKRSYGESATALDAFIGKHGDLELAKKLLPTIGHYANATGADFAELAQNAGILAETMGDIPNKGEAVAASLRVVARQTALGNVEFKDLAQYLPRLAGSVQNFAGSYEDNFAELGVITQAAMKGGRSTAAEATNTAQAFARDLMKKTTQKKLDAAGINVWADKGHTQLRGPRAIMLDLLDKTKGDRKKLAQLLPNQVSAAAVQSVMPMYLEAEKKKKGSGLDAVKSYFAENKKAMTSEGMDSAAALYEGSTASKAQGLQNKIESTFAGGFDALVAKPDDFIKKMTAGLADPTLLSTMIGGGMLGGMLGMGDSGPAADAFKIAAASIVIEQAGEITIAKMREKADAEAKGSIDARNSAQEIRTNAIVAAQAEKDPEKKRAILDAALEAEKAKRAKLADDAQTATGRDAASWAMSLAGPFAPGIGLGSVAPDKGARDNALAGMKETDAHIAALEAEKKKLPDAKITNWAEGAVMIGKAVGAEINAGARVDSSGRSDGVR